MTALLLCSFSVSLLLSASAGASTAPLVPRGDAVLVVGSHRYYLHLAVTPAQQDLGLEGRAKLPPDQGMLFVEITSTNGRQVFLDEGDEIRA